MLEEENKVTISKEDIKNTRDFFTHFNIDIPDYLFNSMNEIEKVENITYAHQAQFKTCVARALVSNKENELLKDPLFEEVMPRCEKEWFDKQFEQDFEQIEPES